jgi:hypothetical protein
VATPDHDHIECVCQRRFIRPGVDLSAAF